MEQILPYLGFILAAYSIIANDSIQTLGTFLSSNAKRPWWQLWAFTAGILALIIVIGFYQGSGDVSFGRLSKIPETTITWMYVLPPVALLLMTRLGLPVSTTFLVLTFFAPKNLNAMVIKSILGYLVAFAASFGLVYFATAALEKKFLDHPPKDKQRKYWAVMQALSTAFLWAQWLIQDLANIYVYMPRKLSLSDLFGTLLIMLGIMAFIYYRKGGKIQRIVTNKTNTADIRAATIIDFTYALVLYIFKEVSKIPMSTTWVFLGILAGREIAMVLKLRHESKAVALRYIGTDMGKALIGLIVSVVMAMGIPALFR